MSEHAHNINYDSPAIYLGTYRKYNNGSLFGQWIDLTTFDDYEDFCDYCHRLHADEHDPEFMVQDFENYPECWYHESGLPTEEEFDRLQEYAELDDEKKEAYKTYLENINADAELQECEERYIGKYDDGSDFAEQFLEECCYLENVPEWLKCCIDYDAVWRTFDTGGDFSEYDGYIFRPY